MSRSYKHTPYAGDKKGKEKKRIANKTVRNKLKYYDSQLFPSAYKRMYPSWNICDYYCIYPWKEYWEREQRFYAWGVARGYKHMTEPDERTEYRKWYCWYKRK